MLIAPFLVKSNMQRRKQLSGAPDEIASLIKWLVLVAAVVLVVVVVLYVSTGFC